MNEPKTPLKLETAEQVSAFAHNRLLTILSRMAFGRHEDAERLTAQLLSDMANIGQRAAMTPAQDNPDRYDLSTLPEKSAFDE